MRTYKLICLTSTGCPQFTHDFDIASQDMAIEYAKRIVETNMQGVRWFHSMDLWQITPEEEHIANISLPEKAEAKVVRSGQ